jgi:hypothetical protein
MATRTTRALVIVLAVAIVAIAGGYGLKQLWNSAKKHFAGDSCTIGDYQIDTEQASVAATMVGAVTKYRITLPEHATVLVLAAALQESKLRNLGPGEGDRDSVGVLQQRPSQGWGGGDPDALTDVGEATKEFLDALMKVPRWRTIPLAEAVQAVQISADGSAYAQHQVEAQELADALQGIKPAAVTCDFETPTVVASAKKVAEQAGYELGIDTPKAVGPRTVRVPGAHWQTVAWFIANGNRLGIEQVAYDGKVWTRTDGWESGDATNKAVVATMYDLTKSPSS